MYCALRGKKKRNVGVLVWIQDHLVSNARGRPLGYNVVHIETQGGQIQLLYIYLFKC